MSTPLLAPVDRARPPGAWSVMTPRWIAQIMAGDGISFATAYYVGGATDPRPLEAQVMVGLLGGTAVFLDRRRVLRSKRLFDVVVARNPRTGLVVTRHFDVTESATGRARRVDIGIGPAAGVRDSRIAPAGQATRSDFRGVGPAAVRWTANFAGGGVGVAATSGLGYVLELQRVLRVWLEAAGPQTATIGAVTVTVQASDVPQNGVFDLATVRALAWAVAARFPERLADTMAALITSVQTSTIVNVVLQAGAGVITAEHYNTTAFQVNMHTTRAPVFGVAPPVSPVVNVIWEGGPSGSVPPLAPFQRVTVAVAPSASVPAPTPGVAYVPPPGAITLADLAASLQPDPAATTPVAPSPASVALAGNPGAAAALGTLLVDPTAFARGAAATSRIPWVPIAMVGGVALLGLVAWLAVREPRSSPTTRSAP